MNTDAVPNLRYVDQLFSAVHACIEEAHQHGVSEESRQYLMEAQVYATLLSRYDPQVYSPPGIRPSGGPTFIGNEEGM